MESALCLYPSDQRSQTKPDRGEHARYRSYLQSLSDDITHYRRYKLQQPHTVKAPGPSSNKTCSSSTARPRD